MLADAFKDRQELLDRADYIESQGDCVWHRYSAGKLRIVAEMLPWQEEQARIFALAEQLGV